MKAIIAALAAAATICSAPLAAQDADDFEMAPPEEGGGQEQVSGDAVLANLDDWPATLKFDSAAGACTASVVGPRAVLTAAHCLPDGAKGTVRVGGRTHDLTCSHHPGYAADHQLDVALCHVSGDRDIRLARGSRRFETLNQSPASPRMDEDLRLLGYGCRGLQGGNPQRALFTSTAPVRLFRGAYVETIGGAALCSGDSGGGAYTTQAPIRLVGVNSRGDAAQRSVLTHLASPPVVVFLHNWSEAHGGAAICGVTAGAANCRG